VILVVSYRGDEHTDAVVAQLRQRGHVMTRIDLADYPQRHGLAFTWKHGQLSLVLDTDAGAVDLTSTRAVWWRRVRPFGFDPDVLDPQARQFIASETQQAIGGALSSLACPWMNPAGADEAAHRKPYQWAMAQEVGLELPATLVTTDPARAAAFVRARRPGQTVFKAFLATEQGWR
jgi:hypothetical protein